MRVVADAICEVVSTQAQRRICAPPATWTDVDTGDCMEAAVTKDGEWIVLTRVSKNRDQIAVFDIPRDVIAQCLRHMGGSL